MKVLSKFKLSGGIIFFLMILCFSWIVLGQERAWASFTYTAPVTQKTGIIGDTTEFFSTLTNTGPGGDTYDVDMIKKPATPGDWWVRFCTGDVCWPPEVTHAEMSLDPSESDEIRLDMAPMSTGTGVVTIRVTSQANPSQKDSITFTLNTGSKTPVLSLRGIIVLILLLSASGFYLKWRKLNPAKAK